MCLYNLHHYNDAISAFEAAARAPRSKHTAGQWINVIRQEMDRNEQIRLAEQAARKKQAEVDAKRAKSGRL